MTPSRPTPAPPPAAPPGVRLDVRLGAGRPATFPLADGGEFLVGGGDRCQLRLPGSGVPAVVCRFTRAADAVTFRRLDPAFPVLVNGGLAGMNPLPLGPGDRVAVGPADVTVNSDGGHLRPAFFPIHPADAIAVPEAIAAPPPADALAADRRRLQAEREQLAEQVRELEADRVLWYRRRQEIEAELGARNPERGTGTADLTAREAQLDAARRELEGIRQSLHEQYEGRREQLAQMQEVVRGATAALHDRQQRVEAESLARAAELDARERDIEQRVEDRLAARRAELDSVPPDHSARDRHLAEREERLAAERDDFDRQRRQHADDLVRLDRLQATTDARTAEAGRQAAEIDERYDQLRRDARELEEHVALAAAERDELAAEAARLARQKADLDTHATRLAERSAQVEAQQATLAVLRATLERQQEEARQDGGQLAADRARLDDAQRELDRRLHEAERLGAELATAEAGTAERERAAAERADLLDLTLAEIQQQKDTLAAEQARLRQKEADLDARSADTAEQTALLRGRLQQALDLQARLEADRTAVREREVTLTDADVARQTFQEQLRRRADELAARSRHLDDAGRRLADDKADLDKLKAELLAARQSVEAETAAVRDALDRRTAELVERESNLARQIQRIQHTGRATADARKELSAARTAWESAKQESAAGQAALKAEFDALIARAPDLDAHARQVAEQLDAARDRLSGHLGELHAFAGQTRQELDAVRAELRAESDRLAAREQALDRARADHRLAAGEFRQQLLGWQATVADLKRAMGRTASAAEAHHAAADQAARHADQTTAALAEQAAALEQERQAVADRRAEVERHLADMREWYKRKLRELAQSNAESGSKNAGLKAAEPDPSGPDHSTIRVPHSAFDIDPADRQLGELLRTRGLVDPDTLAALWADARRQRRTLRQTLLASGAVTLYQLSLIEAGDLDRLVVGRLRVVDRVRGGGRETVYRVNDPARPELSARGLLLRLLAESEVEDAVRPDEFRQRFAAAARLDSPHLWATVEVLDVAGRPAALQEQPAGLNAADWPAEAAVPGVWLRLLTEATAGLSVAHAAGLTHGRLATDHVWLAPDAVLKLAGVGEPAWLAGPPQSADPSPSDDLRALGRLADGWSRLANAAKKRGRGKPFPDTLLAVVRRLLADPESPMGDTAAGANPYPSAEDLLDDLHRLGKLFPCPPDAWQALCGQAGPGDGLRQSA